MEKCSIIIASYNEGENLKKCLASLQAIDSHKESFEIIVIDNNSTDNTAEIVKNFPEVVYLQEKRQGAAFARNKGVQHSKSDIVVFLDADTSVTKKWLYHMTESFQNKKIGAIGGAIYPFSKNNIFSRYLGVSLFLRYPRYKERKEIKGYPSCNLAIRKELIAEGFDTSTFTTYGEDKDICWQILRKGYKVIFEPDAIIYHRHPENLSELLKLLVKSSLGRVNFSKKYPYAPDIVLLHFHFLLIYIVFLVFFSFLWGFKGFLLTVSPLLIYLIYSSILSFIDTKDLLVSFFIKPFLDIFSVCVIYVSYHWHKLSKSSNSQ